MTHLEKLIQAHTENATVLTLSTATERIAEEMAREILKDEAFRAEMQAIIRAAFTNTLRTLRQPPKARKRKPFEFLPTNAPFSRARRPPKARKRKP
jgi:hypothetical protein